MLRLFFNFSNYPKGKIMNKNVGLWIDHKKAIVVALTEEGEEQGLIISNVEKQLRRTGDSPMKGAFEAHQLPADDSRKNAFMRHLENYYDTVIASIRDADAILIFGPGAAKEEFKQRLEKCQPSARVIGIDTADKMTNRQIAAKVRQRFAA